MGEGLHTGSVMENNDISIPLIPLNSRWDILNVSLKSRFDILNDSCAWASPPIPRNDAPPSIALMPGALNEDFISPWNRSRDELMASLS